MAAKGLIYFVSDVHLGAVALKNNRARELLFAGWLDEIKNNVAELYLMGDIFDFWFEYKRVAPRGFIRILGRIAAIADSGVPVHFFVGNHDLWLKEYLVEELGIIIHHKEEVKEIRGKTFFLAHGDGLDSKDTGYHFLKKVFTNKLMQWMFARLHPNFGIYIAHTWSADSRLSKPDYQDDFMVNQDGMYKFAADFLKTTPVDYFVMGHRHRMINEKMDGNARFVLLGDWIKSFSYGVFDGDKFELKRYKDKA